MVAVATPPKVNDQVLSIIREVVGREVSEMIRKHAETTPAAVPVLARQPADDALWLTNRQGRKVKAFHALDAGDRISRFIKAAAAGKNDPARACAWYEQMYGSKDDTIYKALAATDPTSGGFLLPDEMSADVIELLRPASVFRRMNPQMETSDTGTLRLPKITGGASASYIMENANAPATEQTFGQVVANAKKLAALVPISNDMLRRASNSSTIVRDDLVAALAQASDLRFIRGDGLAGVPRGLRFWAPAANLLTVNATINTTNVLADLGRCIQTLMEGNSRMLRPGWLMAPRTWIALMLMTTTLGTPLLRDEIAQGRLMGYPFAVTSQIPTNLAVTGTNESEVYFADFADVVLVEQEGVLIDASDQAAYFDGTNVVAAFSLDQTVVRAIVEHDLVVRHQESIVVLTDVDWTAGITNP